MTTMTTDSAGEVVRLIIPENCRMIGRYESDQDIAIALGAEFDGVKVLLLGRSALERLASLVLKMGAVPFARKPVKPPVVVDPGPSPIPDIAKGEDSEFITQLRHLQTLLGPYAHQLLHPDDPDIEPFGFDVEYGLWAMTTSLAHGIRELAYRRYDEWEYDPDTNDETQD